MEAALRSYHTLYKATGFGFWVIFAILIIVLPVFITFTRKQAVSVVEWSVIMTVILFGLVFMYLAHRFFDCLAHYSTYL